MQGRVAVGELMAPQPQVEQQPLTLTNPERKSTTWLEKSPGRATPPGPGMGTAA